MKKLIIILFIIHISIFTAVSQEEEKNNLSHYIGGAAGFSTGYGLSYRYWPGDYGTQIVFTPISNGNENTINLGTAVFKSMHETKYTRLFLYLAANGTYTDREEYYNERQVGDEWVSDTRQTQSMFGTVGFGPGLEVYLFKNIVIDVMFGYKYTIGDEYNNGVGFTAETALYYRF